MRVQLRYGQGFASLRLPDSATVLAGPSAPPLADPSAAIVRALRQPIASPPLADVVRERRPNSVAISVSDITRPVPNEMVLLALLAELNAAGIGDERITILIATGMHRPSTPAERDIMMGPAVQRRCRVIDHVADDASGVTRVSDDPPVSVNTRFLRSDLRIVTGLIEPHFMAGFSGGRKGVCPGLVDLHTVQRFHGYQVMGDPRSVEGMLQGNPCHEISHRVAHIVGVHFLVNVAITHDRRLAGVYAGDLDQAFLAGCRDVENWTTARFDQPFHLLITNGGGFPLDQSFYQTGKGMVTALPALHARSTLALLSACHEVGSPEFTQTLLKYDGDWRRFLHDIAADPRTHKDQWQYQMMARVLSRIGVERVRFFNDGLPFDLQARLSVTPVQDEGDAPTRLQRFVDQFVAAHPHGRVAVVPEGPYTMLKPA